MTVPEGKSEGRKNESRPHAAQGFEGHTSAEGYFGSNWFNSNSVRKDIRNSQRLLVPCSFCSKAYFKKGLLLLLMEKTPLRPIGA